MFANRDPLSDELQTAISIYYCFGLSKNTKDNHKVTVFRLKSFDTSKFTYIHIIRMILALLDCRLVYCDENELINGEISLIDVTGFSFRHFTKIVSHLGSLKTYMSFTQEAAPVRIVQSHFINCSPLMNRMMSLIKPFLRKEVSDTMFFHSSLESLYEYIPKDILPVDFGGTAESLSETHLKVNEWFKNYRDYLMNDENWRIED